MRKVVLLIAVLLMAVPVMASDVFITAIDDDVNCVTIWYDSDVNLIRAFGLAIEVNDANIVKVDSLNADYRIFPGQIIIEDGEITDYNLPYPEGDLGDANLAIEMGSLYTTDANYELDPNAGYNMIPDACAILLKFYVDTIPCTYTVTEDTVTGGVVMEDPCQPIDVNIVLVDGTIGEVECLKLTDPNYGNWVKVGKPDCWCYPRQCRGDADGTTPYPGVAIWVDLSDLNILRSAISKFVTDPAFPANGGCADFNHKMLYPGVDIPVNLDDLNILRANISKMDIPWNTVVKCCDNDEDCVLDASDNVAFWTGPTTP